MKKAIIVLLCLAVLGGGGYFGYRQYLKNRDEKKVVDVVPVNLMAQPAEWFMYNGQSTWGYISAANAQKVYVDTNKLVQTVCVKQGDEVKKGDTILEYDMTVVELELAQKENQVLMAEQDIKLANKELAELKTYRPSEEAPNLPDYSYPSDFPEVPEESERPEPAPVITVTELTGAVQPVSGTGTAEDPLVYNCNLNTVVRKPFLLTLAGSRRCAALYVYDDSSTFLYQWGLDGSEINMAEAEDWLVTDGLTVDAASGTVSIDPDGTLHGQLSFALPQGLVQPDDTDNPDDFTDIPDDFWGDYTEPEIPDYGNDYLYSRKELQQMISAQEAHIKELEIELKSAQLAYETAKKQKMDGKVVAEIDGIVKKIGKAAGEAEDEPEEEQDPFAEPSEDDNAFAVIEGAGGVEVICEVPELTLAQLPVGTKVNVMSYMNGAFTEAEVTGVEDEPSSYSASPWQTNPNSSMYQLHAKLADSTDFTIGYGVEVTMQQNQGDGAKSKSVFMPMHYVRQEDGDYYIMKADENDRLVKQYVNVGQILWGYYIEITGGLDMSDRICFPYGTDVKEGVRTNDTNEVLYPS